LHNTLVLSQVLMVKYSYDVLLGHLLHW